MAPRLLRARGLLTCVPEERRGKCMEGREDDKVKNEIMRKMEGKRTGNGELWRNGDEEMSVV